MLSIKDIATYLEPNQTLIPMFNKTPNISKPIGNSIYDQYIIKKMNSTGNLPESIKSFLDDADSQYYIYKNIGESHNYLFNFFGAFISSVASEYILYDAIEKETHIINLANNMLIDLEEKNLYNIFQYNRKQKFKKSTLQLLLDHMVHKNSNIHNIYEKYLESIKTYLVDYLKINIFVFYLDKSGNIDKLRSEYILSSIFKETFNKYLPTILLFKSGEYYYPILSTGSNSIFRYTKDSKIIDKLGEYFYLNNIDSDNPVKNTILFTNKDLHKNKLVILKKISEDRGINLKKKSIKTGKMINKTKSELISELIM